MREEIQTILDKDWPDRKTPKGRAMYGAHDKRHALVIVAMRAEDSFDMELYDEAVEQAGLIPSPYEDEKGEFMKIIIPQYHKMMHSEDPKLLIFKEKHGNWYFITTNATEFSLALLTVLEQRQEEGWYMDELYGDAVPKEGEDHNQTDMFKRIDPPKTDKETAQIIIDLARSADPGCVIRAGKKANEFLLSHDDYEYEGFEIEYPSNSTFDTRPEK